MVRNVMEVLVLKVTLTLLCFTGCCESRCVTLETVLDDTVCSSGWSCHLTWLTSWEHQSMRFPNTRGNSTHSFRLNINTKKHLFFWNCKCADLMLIWTNTRWWAALCKSKSQQQIGAKLHQNAWKKTVGNTCASKTSCYFVCSAADKGDFTTLNGGLIREIKGKHLNITWNVLWCTK